MWKLCFQSEKFQRGRPGNIILKIPNYRGKSDITTLFEARRTPCFVDGMYVAAYKDEQDKYSVA